MNCLEVEELVQTSVKDSLRTSSTGSYMDDRVTVVKKLVEALEGDDSWVELYELTGAVFVPSFHDEQSNTLLASVKKVSKELLSATLGLMYFEEVGKTSTSLLLAGGCLENDEDSRRCTPDKREVTFK